MSLLLLLSPACPARVQRLRCCCCLYRLGLVNCCLDRNPDCGTVWTAIKAAVGKGKCLALRVHVGPACWCNSQEAT